MEIDSTISLFIVYRYNSTTGTFTVPPGGDGYYYFSTYLLGTSTEYGNFEIRLNGGPLCLAHYDQERGDEISFLQTSCDTAIFAAQGILH